jgi:hypothetical protein
VEDLLISKSKEIDLVTTFHCKSDGLYKLILKGNAGVVQPQAIVSYKSSWNKPVACSLDSKTINVASLPYNAGSGSIKKDSPFSDNDLKTNSNLSVVKNGCTIWKLNPQTSGTINIQVSTNSSSAQLLIYENCPIDVDHCKLLSKNTVNSTIPIQAEVRSGVNCYIILYSNNSEEEVQYNDISISAPKNITATINSSKNESANVAIAKNTNAEKINSSDELINDSTKAPFSILSIIATPVGQTVHIEWTSINEFGNRQFELQRTTDPQKFTSINTEDGKGIKDSLNEYSYIDEQVQANQIYYYRLAITDYKGQSTYSNIVAAIPQDQGKVVYEVYPNPYKEMTQLHYLLSRPAMISIEVTDVNGRLIKRYQQGLQQAGSYTVPFSAKMNGYQAGIYYLTLWNDDQRYTVKLNEN